VVAGAVGAATAALGWPQHAGWAGALAATLLSVVKEAADDLANEDALLLGDPPAHTVDPWDAAAGAAGGLCWWLGVAVGGAA
jgi:hypothetical protein